VIRLLLVEDQALIRRALAEMFQMAHDVRVVAEVEDGPTALEILRRPGLAVDIVLLDIQLPGISGVELLETLAAEGVATPPVLLLTTFDDDELLLRGIRAGAKGYLLKAVTFEDLCDAVREVAAGGSMIRPALTERVKRALQPPPPPCPPSPLVEKLTLRETEILRLVAGGFSNREIADALRLGEGTVRNYVSEILGKLNVRDRTRAVLRAIELGLL
jgi:DNA-binding NarL/FixJ family response regulator